MKHEKQMSDKKRFWLGMTGCAMVGFLAYALPYFSSTQTFNNEYRTKSLNYNIEVHDIINRNKSMKLWPSVETDLNMDLIVKNSGDFPVLLRIRYFSGWDTEKKQGNPDDIKYYDKVTDEDENPVLDKNGNIILQGGVELNQTEGWLKFSVKNEDKFLYNAYKQEDLSYENDGCYYYKGILKPGESIQHLDKVTSIPDGTSGEGIDYVPQQMYKSINEETKEVIASYTNEGLGKITTIGTGSSVKKYGENIYIDTLGLRAYVETIHAVDENGNPLNEIPDTATTYDLKAYWDKLLKEDDSNSGDN